MAEGGTGCLKVKEGMILAVEELFVNVVMKEVD